VPDLAPFHREIVFVHLLGIFAFLLAHGISAGVIFMVRRERDPAALRALLSLSRQALNVMFAGALVLLVTGILAGFSGNYWATGRLWLWASLAVFVGVFLLMTPLARSPLDKVREALGDGEAAIDAAGLEGAAASARPMAVAGLGLAAVVVLTWLMMYKPF
jgi:hypothetical protein